MQERIAIVVNFHPSTHRSNDILRSINPMQPKIRLKNFKMLFADSRACTTGSVILYFVSLHTLFTTFTWLQVYSGYSSTALSRQL